MKKVLFILGPTGVGKSDLAIKLALKFNGEIISADSVQIYQGLDIGSAKVSEQEQKLVKHYAIDILPPEANFSVFDYVKLTNQLIDEIHKKGKNPIVVGGTGLYVKALTEGYDFGGEGENIALRRELEQMSEMELFNKLIKLNPEKASNIDAKNKRRLVRAVLIELEGKRVSSSRPDIDFLTFAIIDDRDVLYDKINSRVDKMINQGLVEEVTKLKQRGLTCSNQSMNAIGYKEILAFLDGAISLEKAVDLIKQHTRNYAKRQMTFIRGQHYKTFKKTDESKIFKTVRDFYDNKRN